MSNKYAEYSKASENRSMAFKRLHSRGSRACSRKRRHDKAGSERTTYNDDGTLDEIVVTGGAHLEHMDKNRWFLLMTREDGSQVAVWFKGKVSMIEERPND